MNYSKCSVLWSVLTFTVWDVKGNCSVFVPTFSWPRNLNLCTSLKTVWVYHDKVMHFSLYVCGFYNLAKWIMVEIFVSTGQSPWGIRCRVWCRWPCGRWDEKWTQRSIFITRLERPPSGTCSCEYYVYAVVSFIILWSVGMFLLQKLATLTQSELKNLRVISKISNTSHNFIL